MRDKYMVIYQNSACIFRKQIVSEKDLCYWIEKIIEEYQGEIFTISKCLVSEGETNG